MTIYEVRHMHGSRPSPHKPAGWSAYEPKLLMHWIKSKELDKIQSDGVRFLEPLATCKITV